MARNKNARQVHYFIKREKVYNKKPTRYWLYIGQNKPQLIEKKEAGWYASTCYHQTLRDAIIYCLYGV